jgi:hypothetical protein
VGPVLGQLVAAALLVGGLVPLIPEAGRDADRDAVDLDVARDDENVTGGGVAVGLVAVGVDERQAERTALGLEVERWLFH